MNLINSALIDLLLLAAETFTQKMNGILESYKIDRDLEKAISEKYIERDAYFAEKQSALAADARSKIRQAETDFSVAVADNTAQMEAELKKHLSMPVNKLFREKLSTFFDFGIAPEKIEIEELLELNAGNQLGLTALAKTLEKVGSQFVIKFHSTADYQQDIAEIRAIPRNMKYVPVPYLHEGVEIYKGVTDDFVLPDGRVIGGRISYDSVSLLASASIFESEIEKIRDLKNIWTTDCSYEAADLIAKSGNQAEEQSNPESGTVIEDDTVNRLGMQIAIDAGKQQTQAQKTFDELLSYSRNL